MTSNAGKAEPSLLRMHLLIAWNPFQYARDQRFEQPLSHVLAEAITITGHGNEIVADTCRNYMEQIWPESGPHLLTILQRAVQCKPMNCTGTLPDLTRLYVGFTPSALLVDAVGNVYSVADICYQLGWLAAALSTSPSETHPAQSIPVISQLKEKAPSTGYGSIGTIYLTCNISIRINALKASDSTARSPSSCWSGMFRNPVIVSGYPIPRRPVPQSGLEMSLGLIAALTNCREVAKFAGTTFLKGFAAMLVATRVVGGVVFWHLCYNKHGSHISYADGRVPRVPLEEALDTLCFPLGVLQKSRHIVGYTDEVVNLAGDPAANCNIEWTDLGHTRPGSAFDRINLSVTSGFITVAGSFALGIKDKPLHLGFSHGGYMGNLIAMRHRFFVLYDTDDKRGWLIDGASTVLHLLRAHIKHYAKDDALTNIFLCSEDEIEGASEHLAQTGAQAAYQVLSNPKNHKLPLYANLERQTEEKTAKMGVSHDKDETTIKETLSYFTIGDCVEKICSMLLQIIAYHDDVNTHAGLGIRIKQSPLHHLEGFDFMDVATMPPTIYPKVTRIQAISGGWVHLVRQLHAPTFFGVGFGELFRPPGASGATEGGTAPCCPSVALVPKHKDLLAAYGADLKTILLRGSKRTNPWRLCNNVYWHAPGGKAFEPCRCKTDSGGHQRDPAESSGNIMSSVKKLLKPKDLSPADRVQVLLPTSFPNLFGLALSSPQDIVPRGAVLFGHSIKFPLRWSLERTKDGEYAPPLLEATTEDGQSDERSGDSVSDSARDGGISTRIDSSKSPPASTPPKSMYSIGSNPGIFVTGHSDVNEPSAFAPASGPGAGLEVDTPGPSYLDKGKWAESASLPFPARLEEAEESRPSRL